MHKLEWFGGVRSMTLGDSQPLGVPQGHRQHNHLIERMRLPINFNRNYAAILYRLRVIASNSSKVAKFNLP